MEDMLITTCSGLFWGQDNHSCFQTRYILRFFLASPDFFKLVYIWASISTVIYIQP